MKRGPTKRLKAKITANRTKDPSYAHVLLHALAGIYNHTPYDVREARLEHWRTEWPELVTACLSTCSQTGRI